MALTTKQRKQRVKAAWEDLLVIVEGLIADAKVGKANITAGLLKEINSILQGLQAQAETEEAEVRPNDELRAAISSLPDELRRPLRTN